MLSKQDIRIMRTINKISLGIYVAIGLFALASVAFGATHQLAIAAICAIMTAMFWWENKKKMYKEN